MSKGPDTDKKTSSPAIDATLSAALEQSEVSTAQIFIESIFQILRRKDTALAWECYQDIASRDSILRHVTRSQFRQLIKQFNHYVPYSKSLTYVVTLIEDMRRMGYSPDRKERLVVMRLLGLNQKIGDMESIYDSLISSRSTSKLDFTEIQKPYNIVLSCYQNNIDIIGKQQVCEKATRVYSQLVDRIGQPSEGSTLILLDIIREAGYSVSTVEHVWEWFMTKMVKNNAADTMLFKEIALYFACAGWPDYALQVGNIMKEKHISRDIQLMTALIHKVGRKGDTVTAMKLFDELQNEGLEPTTITMNALIDMFAHGKPMDVDQASHMYQTMLDKGLEPDVKTFGTLIDMFAKKSDISMVRRLYDDMKGLSVWPNAYIFSSLIECFVNNGDQTSAVDILRVLREANPYGVDANEVTYNLVMRSYIQRGDIKSALALVHLMQEANLEPTARSFTPILSYFANRGDTTGAYKITEMMTSMGVEANIYTYNVLLKAHAKAGDTQGAERLFHVMSDRWRLNAYAYNSLLYLYTVQDDMDKVFETYREMMEAKVPVDEYCYGILMKLFSQREDPKAVEAIFKRMEDNHVTPSVVCWTILMQTYFNCKNPEEGYRVLDRMNEVGTKPNYGTLSVLIHGLVQADNVKAAEAVLTGSLDRLQSKYDIYQENVAQKFGTQSALANATSTSTEAYRVRLPLTIEEVLQARERHRLPTSLIPAPHMFTPLIMAYARQGDFTKAGETYKRMRQVHSPMTLPVYTSLMFLYKQQHRYDVVETMWLALNKDDDTLLATIDSDLGPLKLPGEDTQGNVIPIIRPELFFPELDFDLPGPDLAYALTLFVDTLYEQERLDDIRQLWVELEQADFAFNSVHWNRYVLTLAKQGDLAYACQLVRDHLLESVPPSSTNQTTPYNTSRATDLPSLHILTCQALAKAMCIPDHEILTPHALRHTVIEQVKEYR